jgi:hypothetical protein
MVLDPLIAEGLIPGGALRRAWPTNYDALRRLPGTLERSRRPVGALLELLPWSAVRSELVLRTEQHPHLPADRNVRSWLVAANSLLDTLATLMETDRAVIDAEFATHPTALTAPRPARG